jgi:hypothetical protein
MGGGPSVPASQPFNFPAPASQPSSVENPSQPSRTAADDIPILSVFHPFPLRLDTQGNGTKIQYDACFQVGEFPSEDPSSKVRGTKIVVLVPLKADPMPGDGAIFINAVSRHIPTILAAQQDPVNGYPDTPAATGADWNISQIIKTDRSYYTWVNRDGTRVIVMAEPILVSEGDITNILRLPVTPPEDVIHEIGDVRYKPAPPIDSKGNPVPCKSRVSVPQVVPGPSAVAMAKMNKPAVSGTDWLAVILGILGSLAVLIGVWFGLKAAMGPGGDFLKTIGDMLGKSLAGGYGALKKARSGTAGVLGIGPGGPLPAQRNALRSPTQVAQAPAITGTPAQVADAPASNIPEPSGDFSVTNPGYSSKQAFIDRHKTQRAPRPGLKIRTPVQVANTPAPAGTPAAMGNIAPVNLPEPSGDFTMKNPGYSSKQAFIDRHKTQRAPRPGLKIRTPAQVAQTPATPGTPAATADIPGPSAEELLRRNRAESFRRKSPAGTGLFDLRTPAGTIDDIAQRKPKGPGRVAITEPEESNAQKIARLARAKKASSPAPAPMRRKIMMEEPDEEETPEERIARRAKETALPRPSYNGPVLQELKRQGNRIDEKGYGGRRKRKNRLKTGRKV